MTHTIVPLITQSSEASEQRAFVKWLRLNNIFFWYTPNGGKKQKRLVKNNQGKYIWVCTEGNHLHALGVLPGVPDIFMPIARKGYNGLFMELKGANGIVSDVQKSVIERLNNEGFLAVVARPNVHAYIAIVCDYLEMPNAA